MPEDRLCAVCHADTKRHCDNPACDWWVCLDEANCRHYGTDERHAQRPKQGAPS